MHKRFEVPRKTGKTEVPIHRIQPGFTPALAGYPKVFVIHKDNYLFNESALKDTAVLAVNLFLSPNQTGGKATLPSNVLTGLLDFSRVSAEFVETSRKQGKSRLIINLQGNSGGLVWNAMSLYATLFPNNSKAHMKMRVHAHHLLDWVRTMLGKMGANIKTMPYPVRSSGFLDKDLKNFTD
ncbi:peptidase S41 family protein ustP [Colletotrichum spaethianum]|uniref:Peptidase S41 family protein ustP n=1 Tax=Colletotrichum spaethianum TaxID=700344 RepID=A0AA37PEE1_9PEZI|nr:peptidase S41 family protein ustP [Colletotrichum spaethianum]GKT50677.1 peptidase S41 family protein ustP [Colletotrichum spaethianum]